MPPLFNPSLINSPTGDPGLFVPFYFNKRAMMFDLGDINALSSRDILKTSHIFITHTHMDHFSGFDRMLRIILGRDKTLYLYGPEGFLKNIEGKLAGYTWNLVENYANHLVLNVTEVTETLAITRCYPCGNRFLSTGGDQARPFSTTLHEEAALRVQTAILDHGIPCMGFALKENFRINIRKDALDRLGLKPGPWLNRFKQVLFDRHDLDETFEIPEGVSVSGDSFTLGDLAREIAIITQGRKLAYISDVAFSPSNIKKIIGLAKGADRLFIEAAFLEKDKGHARNKYHLTARQAGRIAALCGAEQFTLFHFSPRYTHADDRFYGEAMAGFKEVQEGADKGL